jgi:hypothetical protein
MVAVVLNPPSRQIANDPPQARPVVTDATNIEGGYSFALPTSWHVDHDGTVSKVTSPAQDVVVAIGTAPMGNVESLADDVVDRLGGIYSRVRVTSEETMTLGSDPAILIEGRAVNEAGADLYFYALTVKGKGQNFALTAFVSPDAEAQLQESDPVRELIRSFRQTPGSSRRA